MNGMKQAEMKRTAEAIQKVIEDLHIPADVWIHELDGKAPCVGVSARCALYIETFYLPKELVTLQDVSDKMQAIPADYAAKRKPGCTATLYVREQYGYEKKIYEHIADASRAALEIQQGKEPEKVYTAYKKKWMEAEHVSIETQQITEQERLGVTQKTIPEESKEEMERTADAIQDALKELDVPADVWAEDRLDDAPCIAVSMNGVGTVYLPEEFVTLQDVSDKIRAIVADYTARGTYEDERETYEYIADACKAALEIRDGKKPEDVYAAYRERWEKEEMLKDLRKMIETCQKKYGVSEKDIGKALKKVCKDFLPRSQDRQQSR